MLAPGTEEYAGSGLSSVDRPSLNALIARNTVEFDARRPRPANEFRPESIPGRLAAWQVFQGYARIGLRYELLHITMILRVPLLAWSLAQFLAAVAVAIVESLKESGLALQCQVKRPWYRLEADAQMKWEVAGIRGKRLVLGNSGGSGVP
ncbi:hypothetical protein AK812_SmicGene2237 [Symbiodinium microadriaticum]|uniref:Uncharacterized protein n=1 Tax=Symbiodinium microadriaticum TaxID=2951 RepID=A0A1Q9F264_SYMMI|nr:hypothetical protein AK812_SmicGene2237 [Symbiodinium microadriaticum]